MCLLKHNTQANVCFKCEDLAGNGAKLLKQIFRGWMVKTEQSNSDVSLSFPFLSFLLQSTCISLRPVQGPEISIADCSHSLTC